ncbi:MULTISPECIES: GGDEF domain-containing protein [Bacillaceae]|uniref:GGDEF domain-containing protein n=1 Tax=Evansella alkalicola TaxID=745819 RepID=A0ABS6JX55_9BACI|nr:MULTISPECIES: GGDEF domain-containing protein [Bacillaceae]MBU9722812.1 GGDEF domain-containing protein [Bacillus alkalicola]
MRTLLRNAYQSDHALEIIFSSLRWFFLVLAISVFYVQYRESPDTFLLYLFLALVIFGFIYMGVSDYYLHRSPEGSRMYTYMTKGGPFFDFIAFSALVPLTGGIDSPLIPLAYLIILHVAVYWKFIGGMLSACLFILLYSIIFFIQIDGLGMSNLINYASQVVFLFLMGCLGGIIVSRERKHHSEKNLLVETANRDYITNLLNHRSFQEHLRNDLEKEASFYLTLADIDKFKLINDQYGHVTGDKVLRKIGVIMNAIVTEKQGKVFRYGGEEFAIILYSDDHDEVNKLLMEIKETVANHVFTYEGEAFSLTMSFGSSQQNGEKPDRLVDKVDKLLYEAKSRGRDQIVYPEETVETALV